MGMKTYNVEVVQRFEVTIDDEMFDWSDVLDTMEFTTFPDADTYDFLEGSTTYTEVGVV